MALHSCATRIYWIIDLFLFSRRKHWRIRGQNDFDTSSGNGYVFVLVGSGIRMNLSLVDTREEGVELIRGSG